MYRTFLQNNRLLWAILLVLGLGYARGLVEVELRRAAGLDRAEIARARADVAQVISVAVPRDQHSPMFGQRALSQMVWSLCSFTIRRVAS
jgi:hypothetical protein